MKEIELTQGWTTFVSDEDYDGLSKFKWYALRNGSNIYAARNEGRPPFRRTIQMHTVIMKTPRGMKTDHINGNGLDNRRENLRICTHAENMRNSRPHSNNTSGFKGVAWNKRESKWVAHIRLNRKRIHLGYFDTAEAAATAYEKAARELHGEFSRI